MVKQVRWSKNFDEEEMEKKVCWWERKVLDCAFESPDIFVRFFKKQYNRSPCILFSSLLSSSSSSGCVTQVSSWCFLWKWRWFMIRQDFWQWKENQDIDSVVPSTRASLLCFFIEAKAVSEFTCLLLWQKEEGDRVYSLHFVLVDVICGVNQVLSL